MTLLTNTIETAMRERAPKMHAELKAAGKLTARIREMAQDINSEVASATMEARFRGGWDKQNLPFNVMVGNMNAAQASALEVALDEALQFPPEETSRPSPG